MKKYLKPCYDYERERKRQAVASILEHAKKQHIDIYRLLFIDII